MNFQPPEEDDPRDDDQKMQDSVRLDRWTLGAAVARKVAARRVDDERIAELRRIFEAKNNDSYGFRRSRRGNYVNPAIARDWKWFLIGANVKVWYEDRV